MAGPRADTKHDIPSRLGGYELVRELGRGGMGTVFLARQVSLDRPVALKVMNPRWASDPAFAARFTREAYAAAQLVHHNVVQIYDMGEQDGTQFFSMEYVDGTSLGELVRKDGELKPAEAVGYALQAARGLRFAHERGMVHRDVKPDNLLLNAHGVVKVADLGLVKTPAPAGAAPSEALPTVQQAGGLSSLRADVTNAFAAMGSPAYMAPEQCHDAANVDARADIYALGCTLYVLLTGRPPFQGSTALELMSQHVTKPPPPPETIVHGIPAELSAILLKMIAKAPEERQANMGAVVEALEGWMGVRRAGLTGPSEEHLAILERCVRGFNAAPAARLRAPVTLGFFAVAILGLVAAIAAGKGRAAGGLLALLVVTPLAHFVIRGLTRKTYLFGKVRELAFQSHLSDWFLGLVGALLLGGGLALLGLFWVGLGFALAGIGLATAYAFAVDRRLDQQRARALEAAESLLKRLRLQGVPEDEVRAFVARFSGRRWEEFFEQLFGFEARRQAREEIALEGGPARERFARWRDPVADWLDRLVRTRREAKERRYLQAVESRRFQAEGVARREAEERAAAAAELLVEHAAEIKAACTVASGTTVAGRTVNVRRMLEEAERPARRPRRRFNALAFVADVLLGPSVRFLLAAALIAGGAVWVRQNVRPDISDSASVERPLPELAEAFLDPEPPWPPLHSSFLPAAVTDWFDHANTLLAGVLLLNSLFYRGLAALFMVAAAFVAFAGHRLGVPGIEPVRPYQAAMLVGMVLATIGFLVARRRQ